MRQMIQKRKVKSKPGKTPRTRKPETMTLEEWQIALRREYGQSQEFKVKNLGVEAIFSDFEVENPKTRRRYRVCIRGNAPGVNYCSCPDFAVNTLGTCKHIEWLLSKLVRKRGGKRAFQEGYHPPFSEVYLEYGLKRQVRFQAGQASPDALHRLAEAYFDANGALRADKYLSFEQFVRQFHKIDPEGRIYEDVLAFVARVRDDARRSEAIDALFKGGNKSAVFKKLVKADLYPYQQQGAIFAARTGRCLIADDMGLGKTVQAIAAAELLVKTVGIERVLVVCPTALKHQWASEIERFTNRSALVIEGLKPSRSQQYEQESFYKISNYDVIHRDLDGINRWQPDLVILDEAQRIKNWETRRAKSVKQIDTQYAFVLTGTPLENRLSELHSIMEFVDKFHLGPLFRFLHAHEHVDDTGRVIGYKNLDSIKETLGSVLIRRRKREVVRELPERTDKHYFVKMTEEQEAIHAENAQVVMQLVNKWKRMGFLSETDQRRLMVALQYMRMSCNSDYLCNRKTADHSRKMDECAILLDDILQIPENKVVIFSQWLGTHELLIQRLEGEKRPYAFYHGSLARQARKSVLERFKNDPACRILLCTDSGGVGLNLQHASVLINMDQPWNPAVLEQRIGRVHRLGQHRNVQVYHFVSENTIEHSMLEVLKFKTSMFEGVLDGGESEVFLGGSRMKKFMETVESVSSAIPTKETPAESSRETVEDSLMAQEADEVITVAEDETAHDVAAPPTDPVQELLNTGIRLLGAFGKSLQESSGTVRDASRPFAALIKQDAGTGKSELRIPLPDKDTAQQLGSFLSGLGELFQKMGK